jgi:hypothetical protein
MTDRLLLLLLGNPASPDATKARNIRREEKRRRNPQPSSHLDARRKRKKKKRKSQDVHFL